MNIICCPLHIRLSIAHLSSLMFVGLEGPPPMSSFDPTAYVKSWLAAGRHTATDMGRLELDPDKLQFPKYCRVPNVQSFRSNCCKM